jgi:hypothetical protein
MMIAGDFNAKCTEWGGIKTDRGGTYLLDMLGKNGIVSIRVNKKYTFYKNGRTSFLDIVSTDRGLIRKHKGSKIPNVLSASDHTYVLYDFKTKKTRHNVDNFKYSTKGMDIDNFIFKFDLNYGNLFIHNLNDEEVHGERFQTTIETTCAS